MEQEKLLRLLKQYLLDQRCLLRRFDLNATEEIRQSIATDFQAKTIMILDHIYNNFPVESRLLNENFPRPLIDEKEYKYLKRVKKSYGKNRKQELPEKVVLFLKKFFKINSSNNNAISHVNGSVKHKEPNEFGKNIEAKFEANFHSTNGIKPFLDNRRNLIVPGVGIFGAGASIKMSGCTVTGPDGILLIDKLEYSGASNGGNEITLKRGHKKSFEDWAGDCIAVCEEICEEFICIIKE